jgi:phosphohistidine swiveling domain-containing protein
VPAGVWTRKIANDLWADRLTPFLADAMVQTAHRFDLSRALKILGIRATRPTLAVINGYLYVNCRSIENLLAHIPAKLHLPDLKVLFPADFAFDGKSAPSIIRQISAALRIPALVFLEPGIIPFFCVWITRRNQKIIHKRLDHLQQQPAGSARQAFNNLQLLLAVLSRLQISNQWPYFFASYLTWLLRWLMVDCFGYMHDNFLEVLGKKGHNTTIKIEKRFRHLANQIAIDADFQAQFISQPPEKLLPALPSYFREELNAFLSEFGCRSRHRTLVVKRWAEAPEEVVGILQALVRHLNETQAAARSRAPSASIPRQKSKRPFLLGPLIRLTRKFLDLREEQRFLLDQVLYQMRLALLAVGRHSGLNEKIMFLKQAEIRQLVDGDLSGKKGAQIAAERQSRFLKPFDVSTFYVDGRPEDEFQMKGKILRGVGTSPGSVCGRARIVKDPARVNLNCGEILVAENTDPGWTPILSLVKGMVIEEGGLLNHCSIVARELGIPAVVGVRQAVRIIPEGAMITIDGGRGLVSIEED